MNEDRENGAESRRALMKRGVGFLGMGIVFITATGCAFAQEGKLSKAAVGYVDDGRLTGRDCDDCVHFIAAAAPREPASCRIVEGPVSPHGHCRAFTPATGK